MSFFSMLLALLLMQPAVAAPYAAMVMDARTGKVLHSHNADTSLHPASLTKMMTLYIAFEAVVNGELSMDSTITISSNAAREEPSRLGLKAGQKIDLRYLVRAAAIKSANDAATAIAEGISGSEAAFVRRMNDTAKAMGMRQTSFRNAHGLTQQGHLSTARDMTILGRHLIYDYPQYYNLFSRLSTDAGGRMIRHTNRRLLRSYSGADGIKTGYTRAAGFTSVATAERDGKRVIATVLGGRSTASRDQRVAKLLDMGFARAPSEAAVKLPVLPVTAGTGKWHEELKSRSRRPQGRSSGLSFGGTRFTDQGVGSDEVLNARLPHNQTGGVEGEYGARDADTTAMSVDMPALVQQAARHRAPPSLDHGYEGGEASPAVPIVDDTKPALLSLTSGGQQAKAASDNQPIQELVIRPRQQGPGSWGISVGNFPNSYLAEKATIKAALIGMTDLQEAQGKVVHERTGFEARFFRLNRQSAERACMRLQMRNIACQVFGPTSGAPS